MDALLHDLRYAVRQMRRRPGFTAVAVLTLALGIGATTAIFSAAHAVLFRPLPFADADRLVLVWESNPGEGWSERNVVSSGNFMDWRDQATSFEGLAAFSWRYGVGIAGEDSEPVRAMARRGSPDLFRVLGVAPLHGRIPSEAEVGAGERGVLLGHGLWQRRYGGDPALVGDRILIHETPVTVLGVLPPDLGVPTLDADLWFPVAFDEEDRASRRSHQWQVLGRLRPAVGLERARAEMEAIADRIRERHPEFMQGFGTRVVPFRQDMVREVRPLLLVLLGVVAAVLLIVCANLANLLLARAVARRGELAIRGAIGAGRARLVRQLLTESGVLALVGGAAGIALAVPGTQALLSLAPADIPLLDRARLDGTVLGVAAGVSVLSTLLFGALPALRAGRTDPERALRGARGTPDRSQGILRRTFLQAQVALCVVLLAGAGLLFRSFLQLQAVDAGFRAEGLLAVSLDLPHSRYDGTADHVAFYEALLERVRGLPGVVSATGTPEPPVIGFNNTFSFVIQGRPRPGPDPREEPVEVRAVTPGYFRTMGIPLLRGRALQEADRDDAPLVGVINESLARALWPGGDAVGARISFDDEVPDGERAWIEVVGVASDTRHYGLDRPAQPALYIPHAQKRWGWMSWMTLLVRTSGEPLSLASAVRDAVWELDDRLPIHRLAPVTELYAESHARRRFAAQLLGLFAGLALLLGAVGVYGVVSYGVVRRRREFGIRLALGAEVRRIAASVVGDGLRVALVGIAVGVLAALLLTRLLAALLFDVSPHDPPTFMGVVLLIVAVAGVASWIPARQAMREDPMAVLREE